eukprot:CAMPEP_0119035962 /NCGR_PEP_ID=MMETSP1177-20130426/3286_1 /TAXON_ID=2985 /ORGANISM="Ochromonas sp, Strain CCMP1899" /LENGTH=724 /DNA_ID=CAMNT_0006994953 /DNA_START=56 /DNA_END=2227 /DNA_ORIENTATION=-
MSASTGSTSVKGTKVTKRRYMKELGPTILSIVDDDEDDSDEDYDDEDVECEELDEDDGEDYIDDDEEIDLPDDGEIDSQKVKEWQLLLTGNKAVPHALARERVTKRDRPSRGLNKRTREVGVNKSDTPSISASFRVNQYPDHFLAVRTGKLFCTCCNVEVAKRKQGIKQHIGSQKHKDGIVKKKALITQRQGSNIEDAVGRIPNINTIQASSYRTIVCKALLIGGVHFEVLEDNDACTLRHILEDGGGATLPRRETGDNIPVLLAAEIKSIYEELGPGDFSIIFDGTPAVAEVFGMVIRFVNKDYIICHRAIALRFYMATFTLEHLAGEIVRILSTQHGINMNRVLFGVCDGCLTNGAAIRTINLLQPSLIGVICISHAANVVGSVLKMECKTAEKFICHWATLINSCPRVRSLYKTLSNEAVKKPSAVRWFVWLEMAQQILSTFVSVESIVYHEDGFNPETRNKMKSILEESKIDLRLELALIVDVGTEVVQLCYHQEGDGFLAPTSYDHWNSVMNGLSNIVEVNKSVLEKLDYLPLTDQLSRELIPNDEERVEKMKVLIDKVVPLYRKMSYDTRERMDPTLNLFRACRVLNYKFVSNTPLNALRNEIEQLQRIPSCIRTMHKLREELENYRDISVTEALKPMEEQMDLWTFWTTHALSLPNYFIVACIVALIPPSSAVCERLFARLVMGFDEDQENCLEDYKAASTIIRFNRSLMKSNGQVP